MRAAAAVAAANGFPDAITFDMGGTSTDVCLVDGGVPDPAPSLVVGGYPVRLPSLDDPHRSAPAAARSPRIDAGGALAGRPAVGRRRARAGLLRARRHASRR